MPSVLERFKKSWNAFTGRDPTEQQYIQVSESFGTGYGVRPDRMRFTRTNATTLIAAVYNRIAMDVASIEFKHVRVDEDRTYKGDIDSYLNDCLSFSANIDQTGRALIQDIVQSMFDEGSVAVVPVDADLNSTRTRVNEAKIYSLRVGKILTWYPQAVKVKLYNELTGRKEDIIVPKTLCAIIENPLYSIMNEPNSTLQRLLRTINQLNSYNDQNTSDKLNMIIQLPYIVKSEIKRNEAKRRMQDLEEQLANSKYGVAYADGTEKIIQLNRSLENNLWQQVKDLTAELYNQLGMTENVFNGTANEQEMINYNNRTIEPLCAAITLEMARKFITPTARTQGQDIRYFRDPFKLVPVNQIADMADKFTRNEIMSSNEFRTKIGLKPSDDPKADELRNSNLNQSNEELAEKNSALPGMEEGNDIPPEEIPKPRANAKKPESDEVEALIKSMTGG